MPGSLHTKRTMLIQITKECIRKGQRKDCKRCPIARAIIKKFPNLLINVHGDYVNFASSGKFSVRVELPAIAQKFIKEFDFHYGGEPFEFEIDVPDEVLAV